MEHILLLMIFSCGLLILIAIMLVSINQKLSDLNNFLGGGQFQQLMEKTLAEKKDEL